MRTVFLVTLALLSTLSGAAPLVPGYEPYTIERDETLNSPEVVNLSTFVYQPSASEERAFLPNPPHREDWFETLPRDRWPEPGPTMSLISELGIDLRKYHPWAWVVSAQCTAFALVLDENRMPLEGASVTRYTLDGELLTNPHTTVPDGTVGWIYSCMQRPHIVVVHMDGYVSQFVTVTDWGDYVFALHRPFGTSPGDPRYLITGCVVEPTTGDPIPSRTVSLRQVEAGAFPGFVRHDLTDREGRFEFTDLYPGMILEASIWFPEPPSLDEHSTWSAGIRLTPQNPTAELILQMPTRE